MKTPSKEALAERARIVEFLRRSASADVDMSAFEAVSPGLVVDAERQVTWVMQLVADMIESGYHDGAGR